MWIDAEEARKHSDSYAEMLRKQDEKRDSTSEFLTKVYRDIEDNCKHGMSYILITIENHDIDLKHVEAILVFRGYTVEYLYSLKYCELMDRDVPRYLHVSW